MLSSSAITRASSKVPGADTPARGYSLRPLPAGKARKSGVVLAQPAGYVPSLQGQNLMLLTGTSVRAFLGPPVSRDG